MSTVLILVPEVPEQSEVQSTIAATRLYNLTEYLKAQGWDCAVAASSSDVPPTGNRHLLAVRRRGQTAHDVQKPFRREIASFPESSEGDLDWSDIDDTDPIRTGGLAALGELNSPQWPPRSWFGIPAPPEPTRSTQWSRWFGHEAYQAGERQAEAEDGGDAPPSRHALIAFAGDSQPRTFDPPRVVSADGAVMASLDNGVLALYDGAGRRTGHFPQWTSERGLDADTTMLAIGTGLDARWLQVVVASGSGTFCVVSADRERWSAPERIGEPARAAAVLRDSTFIALQSGGIMQRGPHGDTELPTSMIVHSLDAAVRGGRSWLVACGADSTGRAAAELVHRPPRRSRWIGLDSIAGAVAAGFERVPLHHGTPGPLRLWVTSSDGSTDRREVIDA